MGDSAPAALSSPKESDATSPKSPTKEHHVWANELLKRSVDGYLQILIKDYASGLCSFTGEGLEIEPFEIDQRPLIALMAGNCPISEVKLGKCKIAVPHSIAHPENMNAVHIQLESVEFNMLAYPNMLPSDQVSEIMHQLGMSVEQGADSSTTIYLPTARKQDRGIRSTWYYRWLQFLDGPVALAVMLLLVICRYRK